MSRVDHRRLLAVVRNIHDAAFAPELWPASLADLAALFASDKVALTVWDDRHRAVPLLLTHGCEPRWTGLYRAHYIDLDPWVAACRRLPPGTAGRTQEMLSSRDEFVRSEFYNDFCRPQDMFHLVGGVIVGQPNRNLHLAVLRPERRGPYGESQLAVMQQVIFGHMALAMCHRRLLLEAEIHGQHLAAALDRLTAGDAIVDGSCALLWMNRAAEALARDPASGVLVRHGRLTCRDPTRHADLAAFVHRAAETVAGRALFAGAAIHLDREAGGLLAVHVSPLPRENLSDAWRGGSGAVLVVITDPDTVRPAPAGLLRQLHGLTPAEARLAAALAAGRMLSEHAGLAGITHETARGHLKQVLLKTGTRRQSGLVRLLALGPAGLLQHHADDLNRPKK